VNVYERFLGGLRARVHSNQLRAYQLRSSGSCRSLLLICILRPVCAGLAANGFVGSTQATVVLDIVRQPDSCWNFHRYLSRAEPARHLLGKHPVNGNNRKDAYHHEEGHVRGSSGMNAKSACRNIVAWTLLQNGSVAMCFERDMLATRLSIGANIGSTKHCSAQKYPQGGK
jgi:hypothetical protein